MVRRFLQSLYPLARLFTAWMILFILPSTVVHLGTEPIEDLGEVIVHHFDDTSQCRDTGMFGNYHISLYTYGFDTAPKDKIFGPFVKNRGLNDRILRDRLTTISKIS